MWKLQRFDRDEFERNWSVIKHLRAERAETPIDLESVKQSVIQKRDYYLAQETGAVNEEPSGSEYSDALRQETDYKDLSRNESTRMINAQSVVFEKDV